MCHATFVTVTPSDSQSGGMSVASTRHAAMRLQQRGIRPKVLEYLLDYGHEEHDHRGGIVVTFAGRSLASAEWRPSDDVRLRAHDCRSVYAVIDIDGNLITTGHRTRRVKRDRSLRTLRSTGILHGLRQTQALGAGLAN